MLEKLPEQVRDRVVDHLREYLEELRNGQWFLGRHRLYFTVHFWSYVSVRDDSFQNLVIWQIEAFIPCRDVILSEGMRGPARKRRGRFL